MIGTDEMSSTGMDISESFRAEDLSKTDFFDFVTAPDMGIGIGVGVSLHTHHHNHSHHHHHHQQSHNERTNAAASMTHDGGGGGGGGPGGESTTGRSAGNGDISRVGATDANSVNNVNSASESALHSYEFWHTDKEHSRLESTIFEDLDRYCWQQQQSHTSAQQQQPTSAIATSSAAVSASQHHTHQQQQTSSTVNAITHPAHTQPTSPNQQQQQLNNSHANNNTSSSSSISQPSSAGTVTSIENNDGQIYTITVLNGNEPWLKREPDTQLPSTLDLDSLLGNFPSYIKSEYPYDDSGFSTDGTKDVNGGGGGEANGISIPQLTAHHSLGAASGQRLPSLVSAISAVSGGGGAGSASQQLAQFQNNNNDWHMADHNADQNSAESLLRSALQGKGYSKGLHMQNGITLLPPSPSVKDDDMRRILFPPDADSLAFADSTLNTAQIFEDTQNAAHNSHLVGGHHPATSNGPLSVNANANNSSIIVDDMFLSLENAFSDDFEKIKRIANEVQQFCTNTSADYGGDVMMQISPSTPTQLQQLHSPVATTPTGMTTPQPQQPPPPLHMQATQSGATAQVPPPPQPLKPEVTTSTASRIGGTSKSSKKYKRSTSATHNNNNNNPNVINHNSSNNGVNGGGGVGVGGGNNMSNNNANVASNGGSSSSNSSNSPTHCNGQRKERSLHYCSICSKGFKDKYSVNVHIRTHTGEKPFACSLCGKSFRQKAHLAKHYQTHMAQKNNGSLVKGGSAKHHRAGVVPAGGGAVTHQRQLSVAALNAAQNSSGSGGGVGVGVGGGVGVGMNVAGLMSGGNGVSLNVPTTVSPANAILPPANGLLANR